MTQYNSEISGKIICIFIPLTESSFSLLISPFFRQICLKECCGVKGENPRSCIERRREKPLGLVQTVQYLTVQLRAPLLWQTMAVTWNILLGILGKDVPLGSLNSDPISDQNTHAIPHNRFQTWSLKSTFELVILSN